MYQIQISKKYNFAKEHLEEIFRCVLSEPEWFQLSCKIDELKSEWRNLDDEFDSFDEKLLKRTNYNTKKDNLILRLIFAPLTLCLSFIGYRSQNRIKRYEILNKENAEYNKMLIQDYEIKKASLVSEIKNHNSKIWNEISQINQELKK